MVGIRVPGQHYSGGQGQVQAGAMRMEVQACGWSFTIGNGATGLRVVLYLSSRHLPILLRSSYILSFLLDRVRRRCQECRQGHWAEGHSCLLRGGGYVERQIYMSRLGKFVSLFRANIFYLFILFRYKWAGAVCGR